MHWQQIKIQHEKLFTTIVVLLALTATAQAEVKVAEAFSSQNYFTRYVKRTIGMTPSEYRSRHKAWE